jgi:hypothetical protein
VLELAAGLLLLLSLIGVMWLIAESRKPNGPKWD